MVESKIFYICDKKKHCNKNSSCAMYCHHTSDPDHAKNGAIRAPSEAVGRFIEMPVTDSNVICYFEKEVDEVAL